MCIHSMHACAHIYIHTYKVFFLRDGKIAQSICLSCKKSWVLYQSSPHKVTVIIFKTSSVFRKDPRLEASRCFSHHATVPTRPPCLIPPAFSPVLKPEALNSRCFVLIAPDSDISFSQIRQLPLLFPVHPSSTLSPRDSSLEWLQYPRALSGLGK